MESITLIKVLTDGEHTANLPVRNNVTVGDLKHSAISHLLQQDKDPASYAIRLQRVDKTHDLCSHDETVLFSHPNLKDSQLLLDKDKIVYLITAKYPPHRPWLKTQDKMLKIGDVAIPIGYDNIETSNVVAVKRYERPNRGNSPIIVKTYPLEGEHWVYIDYSDPDHKYGRIIDSQTAVSKESVVIKKIRFKKYVPDVETGCVGKVLSTWSGGNMARISNLTFTEEDLQMIAFNLDLSVNSCEYVKSNLPPIMWQLGSFWGGPNISPRVSEVIDSYINYGYQSINDDLRYGQDDDPILNQVIQTLPPLPKSIIVTRYTSDLSTWIDYTKPFNIRGYLSVSYDPRTSFRIYNDPTSAILVITVPSGKKGIFIGGKEAEIIFPHNNTFKVQKVLDKQIVYKKTGNLIFDERSLDERDKLFHLADDSVKTGKTKVIYLEML